MEGPKGRIELSGGSFGINLPQVNQDSLSIARSSQLLDVRKLHVEFAAPFYDDPASTVYRYRLYNAGIDSTWSPWTNQTAVEMNVPGVGEYEFQVEAKNVYNVTSARAFYRFEVVPRWHETFWARALFVLGLLLVLGLLVYLFIRWQTYRLQERNRVLEEMVEARTQELRIEQEKSENLLLNILPKAIADELKEKDRADAREYERVTVLFTDFKGFTKVSEKLSPNAIIEELNVCFTAFDDIMGKYHLEKIKTIGDAYMCAGGIPAPNPTNPVDMVLAALEIQEFMRKMAVLKTARGEDFWELRLGIHTGPLVAGVVGKKKFAYDIWGDTVNTASRMESSGEPNRVNISGTTYDLVSEFFVCTYRGKLPAKNKGDIDMYFVERLRPELSLDAAGLIPNDLFYARLKKELGTAAYAPVKTG